MEEWRTWTNEELENQMSSSRWNPNKSGDDVINQYISICSAETERARQRIPHKLDIAYGSSSSSNQKYDLYGTDLPVTAMIFFWIHGGYWQEGSKDISATMVESLHSVGVKTVVLGYTLAPNATLHQIQQEVFSALAHLLQAFPGAKYVVGGHSAGAQLAAMLLHRQCVHPDTERPNLNRLAGLALFSGVYDLRPLVSTYVNDPLKLTETEAEKLSPLLLPSDATGLKEDISVLVGIGQYESPEFKRQSLDYSKKLKEKYPKANVKHWESAKDDHFTIIERLADMSSESSPGSVLVDFVKSIKAKADLCIN